MKKLRVKAQACIEVLKKFLPKDEVSEGTAAEQGNATEPARNQGSSSGFAPGSVPVSRDREQARRKLYELVVYFRTTEAHSPVSWMLEKAFDWLDFSFPELLRVISGERQDLHDELCQPLPDIAVPQVTLKC